MNKTKRVLYFMMILTLTISLTSGCQLAVSPSGSPPIPSQTSRKAASRPPILTFCSEKESSFCARKFPRFQYQAVKYSTFPPVPLHHDG